MSPSSPSSSSYSSSSSSSSYFPDNPDLVIITSTHPDHCHEPTLRHILLSSPRTLILASPDAARTIRKWKRFDRSRVRVLTPWVNMVQHRQDKKNNTTVAAAATTKKEALSAVTRIPLQQQQQSPLPPHDQAGEITIAYIIPPPPKLNTSKSPRGAAVLHAMIGLTFRPPPTTTQRGVISSSATRLQLRPARSAATLRCGNSNASSSSSSSQRTLSLLYAPHEMPSFADSLASYATEHLVGEAALPLTALIGGSRGGAADSRRWHRRHRRWWWWSSSSSGNEAVEKADSANVAGREVAMRLGARVWIGSGDRGGDGKMMRRTCFCTGNENGRPVTAGAGMRPVKREHECCAQILELARGDKVVLTSQGVHDDVDVLRT